MTVRPVISRVAASARHLQPPRSAQRLSSSGLARSLCLLAPRRTSPGQRPRRLPTPNTTLDVRLARSYVTNTTDEHTHDDILRIARGLIRQKERILESDATANARELEALRSEVGALGKHIDDLEQAIKIHRQTQDLASDDPDVEMRTLATSDLPDLLSALDQTASSLRSLLLSYRPSPNAAVNLAPVILDFNEGEGGPDSAWWNSKLLKIYEEEFARQGWKWKIVQERYREVTGLKGALGLSEGSIEVWDPKAGKKGEGEVGVFGRLKWEAGVHRLQAVSEADRAKRIMTSAAVVYVLPTGPLAESDTSEEDLVDWKDIRIDLMRASGPGGQHVNKTESAVRLVHIPTNITVIMQDSRSQPENKAAAYRNLRSRVLDVRRRERAAEILAQRNTTIRGTSKSDRVRTYNYPQGRVTDHRIGLSIPLQSVDPGGIGLETIHAELEEQDEEFRLKDLREELEAED